MFGEFGGVSPLHEFLVHENLLEEHSEAISAWLNSQEFRQILTEPKYKYYKPTASSILSAHNSLVSDLKVLKQRLKLWLPSGEKGSRNDVYFGSVFLAFQHMDTLNSTLVKGTQVLAQVAKESNMSGFTAFSLRVDAFAGEFTSATSCLAQMFKTRQF